ncbi:MAG: CDP-alcohol phosphatidyltransferase family protein [Desulfobacterales bacterium]|jgi:cardiolipin synthase|nr:CDP-alcohol phosphatidyltransferase family protein [Desulfobacterales bacterium]
MTVPNLITTIRIILAPVFVIYLINDQFLPALIVFLLCAVSDGLDGMVARLMNQRSKLGAYLDPLADKLLLVAAFVTLSVRGYLPAWLTVLVFSRDTIILLGVLVLFLNRMEFSIKPTPVSKITTWLQFITVLAVLSQSYMSSFTKFYPYIFYLTALLTISSGLHYMHNWFRMIGEGSAER